MNRPLVPFVPSPPVPPQKIITEEDSVSIDGMCLFDLLKKIPDGIDLKDVVFKIENSYDDSYIEMYWSVTKENPNYEKQMKAYNHELSIFKKQLEAYQKQLDQYYCDMKKYIEQNSK